MSDQDMLDLTMRDLAAKLALLAWYEEREPLILAAYLRAPGVDVWTYWEKRETALRDWEKANPCPK